MTLQPRLARRVVKSSMPVLAPFCGQRRNFIVLRANGILFVWFVRPTLRNHRQRERIPNPLANRAGRNPVASGRNSRGYKKVSLELSEAARLTRPPKGAHAYA